MACRGVAFMAYRRRSDGKCRGIAVVCHGKCHCRWQPVGVAVMPWGPGKPHGLPRQISRDPTIEVQYCALISPDGRRRQDSMLLHKIAHMSPSKTPHNTTETHRNVRIRRERTAEGGKGRKGDCEHDGGRHLLGLESEN